MRIVINNLKKVFQNAMSDAERDSPDDHLARFKD